MVCREGDWLIWGAGSHVEYDQSVILDFSSASNALYSYFEALNTYSADCILSVFRLYDLSAEQVSYVRKNFGIISAGDAEQELFYQIIDFIVLFEEDDYVEYRVEFSQKVDGYVVRNAFVLLDFVWTEYGWRMLPENYIYDQNGSRPDYSALSPKYGAIHYLDVLPCGDYERILSCFSLEGLSESEKESFRQTIRDYSLNTWYTYVFQYVSYLDYGSDTAQIEVAYLWNGIEKRIAFTMVREDGVWKILAKSQPHMYVSDSL